MKTIGIDWGHREICVAVAHDASRPPVCTYLATHQLADLLDLLHAQGDTDSVRILMEAGKHLLADSLRARGLHVVEVAPDRADAARRAYFPGGAKDDRRDARALALAAQEAPRLLGALVPLSPQRRELRQLTQARTRVVHCRVRALQQLVDVVRGGHPGLAALDLDYCRDYALALAKAYAHPLRAHRARRARIERLTRRARTLDVDHVIACLHDRSHTIGEQVAEATALEIQMTVQRIELLSRQIARLDKHIAAVFNEHPDVSIFRSIPGSGPALAPRLAARLDGETARSMSAVKAQVLAGTAPRNQGSGGRHKGSVTRRIAADRDLHQAAVGLARGSLRSSPWARAFVHHHTGGRLRDPKRFHRAIRALANKWIRILHALLVRRETYDERLHVQHLKDAGVPWAQHLEVAA